MSYIYVVSSLVASIWPLSIWNELAMLRECLGFILVNLTTTVLDSADPDILI